MNGEYLRGCVNAPYIVWRGRFLGEKSAGILATDVGMAVATFLPKLRGPGTRPGSAGPTLPPLPTDFCRETGEWVLLIIRRCRGFIHQFALLCGPFVSVMQGWILCAIMLRLLSIFVLIRVWVPAIQESPKVMETVRNKPYNYFWCLKVMKRCRS